MLLWPLATTGYASSLRFRRSRAPTPATTDERLELAQEVFLRMKRFHDIEMPSITGETVELSRYQDQVCLIVNVASQ